VCKLGNGDFCSKTSFRGALGCVGDLGSVRVALRVFGELRVVFIGVSSRRAATGD
jgi:hypothetical protein